MRDSKGRFVKGHRPWHKEKHTGYIPRSAFKKGFTPWNKGKKGLQVPWNKGKKFPEFSKEHCHLWRGGKIIRSGYILVRQHEHPFANNQGYVRQHRLVVEKIIGRYLLSTEPVHHLGKRNNNRPHMLMAFSNKKAHERFERNLSIKSEEIIFDGRKFHH